MSYYPSFQFNIVLIGMKIAGNFSHYKEISHEFNIIIYLFSIDVVFLLFNRSVHVFYTEIRHHRRWPNPILAVFKR